MTIDQLFQLTIANKASDGHLIVGVAPTLRINGELMPVTGAGVLTAEAVGNLVLPLLSEKKRQTLAEFRELDWSHSLPDGTRFRFNAYYTFGNLAASFRIIPKKPPTIKELNLPELLYQFTSLKQGFILVTGPTGHGKSTTVAAMLEEINQTRQGHIISIEDPIEYVFKPGKAIISQREVGSDTLKWQNALRSALREDPDVVFVGEMRDLETIALALTIAETGHLVFSTLHTNSAAQTIDRIIDVFPQGSQQQIRSQLASVLVAVVSQRLVPTKEKLQRMPATEILISNPAVKTAIREGKVHMIDNIIQTSLETGMISLERSLANLIKNGYITLETAQLFSLRPEELQRYLKR